MKILKKMKKVLFFALLPMILGAVSVNAQVRIGGDGAPHTTAVLDLNATDATVNGNRGLALPRVSLAGEAAQLNGANPKDGTLVYNTSSSFGVGLYYWVTDKWVKLTIDGGAQPALNVTPELTDDYVVKATDDIVLFTTPGAFKNITLPASDVPVGKTIYISDKGTGGLNLPLSSLRTGSYSVIYAGYAATLVYIGDGKWEVFSGN